MEGTVVFSFHVKVNLFNTFCVVFLRVLHNAMSESKGCIFSAFVGNVDGGGRVYALIYLLKMTVSPANVLQKFSVLAYSQE